MNNVRLIGIDHALQVGAQSRHVAPVKGLPTAQPGNDLDPVRDPAHFSGTLRRLQLQKCHGMRRPGQRAEEAVVVRRVRAGEIDYACQVSRVKCQGQFFERGAEVVFSWLSNERFNPPMRAFDLSACWYKESKVSLSIKPASNET